MGSLGTRLHRDCNAMGDAAKTSPHVPSTWVQNAILALQSVHSIPNFLICMATNHPLLVTSVSCPTTGTYLWNFVCAADNVSYAENLQINCCQCFAHLYTFRDGIQVT
jgi:hypothetical protein